MKRSSFISYFSVLRRMRIVRLLLAFSLSTLLIPGAQADDVYARIRGIVVDAAGGVMSGVEVTATNAQTGISKQTKTSTNGEYEFIQLAAPGNYTLTVQHAGFRSYRAENIHVEVAQIFVQNIHLELGPISETVTVEANPVQVEQSSMQLTANINAQSLVNLPLIGRNVITLQQTLPGVVTPDTRFGTNYSTNGSQAQQNSYLINGTDHNDLVLNSPLVTPIPDSLEEVKMVTNTINPEYGRNSGAIINAITKSGTNEIHGSLFEFFRDTSLNTHNYFQLHPSVFHQNQFGGTVGGPILKNKLFAFFAIQVTRARQPDGNFNGQYPTVFSSAQLAGNWDPTVLSTNPIPFAGGVAGPSGNCPQGTAWNACFVGGVVPTSNYNPLSTKLVSQFVPAANTGSGQYSFNPVQTVTTNQFLGRADYTLSEKNSIWFYGFANDSSSVNTIPFSGATLPGFGDQSTPFTKQFTAAWNHVFTPDVLNELRFGYSRLNFASGQPNTVRQPASVGFPNILPQLPSGADYPQIAINGYFTLGGTNNGPQPRIDQTYEATDNFSWIRGKHSFKFGYDGRKFEVHNPFANSNDGVFTFNTAGIYSTGDPGLDFLLGVPSQYTQGSGAIIKAYGYENYIYGQDQWHVRPNLTITLGAGYQIDTPIAEYQNKGLSRVCFQPGVQSTVFPTAPVGYTLPGDPGCNKYGGASTKYNHVGPRAGFAYAPDWGWLSGGKGKTSIRGGFGLYFNRSEEELNLQDLGIAPFGLTSAGVTDVSNQTNSYVPSFPNPFQDIASGFSIPNKFPYVSPAPGTTNIDFTQFEPFGFNLSVIPKNFTNPYSMNFNLTLERELPGSTILRVSYVGAQGRKLITSYTFNPTTTAGVQKCLADPACAATGGFTLPTDHPDYYVYPGNIWGNAGQQTNGGTSNYNALQVTVEKHLSHGLQFQTSYTYSHSLDISSSFEDTAFLAAGGVDPYGQFGRDYGSSAFDARNRWVGSAVYEIPGPKFSSTILNRVVNGWQISGIATWQSGFPINLQDSNTLSLTCSGAYSFYGCPDRPDLVSIPTVMDPRASAKHYYFNPSAFTDNAVGTLGNVGRGFLTGPTYSNVDFSLQKNTPITEGKALQLRVELYNLFNHTNFANPSGDVASSRFGQVRGIRSFTNSRLVQLAAKFVF
jgi:Carboxypeptidase regulatory-like domain